MDFKGSDDDQTARFEGITGILDQKAAFKVNINKLNQYNQYKLTRT